MRSVRWFTCGLLSFVTAGSSIAAPLQPKNGQFSVSINGGGIVNNATLLTYSGSAKSNGFTQNGLQLSDGGLFSNTPANTGGGQLGSASAARIEKLADNEYVLILSSRASAGLSRTATDVTGGAHARSQLYASIQFDILPSAGHSQGSPATVMIEVLERGRLTTHNGGSATANLTLEVKATGETVGFRYTDNLQVPIMPVDPFDDYTYTGVRNKTLTAQLASQVGQTITLSSSWFMDASTDLLASQPLLERSGAADFTDGLRLHLTVLPEPASVLLLLVSAALLRRGNCCRVSI